MPSSRRSKDARCEARRERMRAGDVASFTEPQRKLLRYIAKEDRPVLGGRAAPMSAARALAKARLITVKIDDGDEIAVLTIAGRRAAGVR